MSTVLLVEDEPSIRAFVALYLQRMNLKVVEAADAGAALEYLHLHDDVELILTDYLMPGGTGLMLAESAREAGFGNIPVVILTAYKDQIPEGPPVALVLEKPIRFEVLKEALAPFISGRHL
jgi:CheY-like chemotaxis protein